MSTAPHLAPASIAQRAAVHRALGEPVRLAIVDLLARTDLAPSEVEDVLGLPSNLLAHHLGVLEAAGLVERHRSQGDGRRRYLALRPEARAFAAFDAPPIEADRIVFVCTRNSARSPLAAALWARTRPEIPATSAGTEPAARIHPLAVRAGMTAGLALDCAPQHLAGVMHEGDLVVTVCDRAHEDPATRAAMPTGATSLHWSVPDPVTAGDPDAFEQTIQLLQSRIDHFMPRRRSPEGTRDA